jgi:hypothetical protein
MALSLLAASFLGLSTSAAPQNPDVPVIHATTELVLLDALVIDSKNNPPTVALGPNDFCSRKTVHRR